MIEGAVPTALPETPNPIEREILHPDPQVKPYPNPSLISSALFQYVAGLIGHGYKENKVPTEAHRLL